MTSILQRKAGVHRHGHMQAVVDSRLPAWATLEEQLCSSNLQLDTARTSLLVIYNISSTVCTAACKLNTYAGTMMTSTSEWQLPVIIARPPEQQHHHQGHQRCTTQPYLTAHLASDVSQTSRCRPTPEGKQISSATM